MSLKSGFLELEIISIQDVKHMDNWLKKGKNWVEYIYITEELGKKTIGIAIKRILTLLESAKILLEQGGDPTISAGIYTYAIEEYGKIVLLRESPRINGKIKVEFKGGFKNHFRKIGIAVDQLPDECKYLRKGIFDPSIFDPNIFDTQDVVADFESRMGVFFTDFSETERDIQNVPIVDGITLMNAITKLRMHILDSQNDF
jgi:AbiV family abortive infection protein